MRKTILLAIVWVFVVTPGITQQYRMVMTDLGLPVIDFSQPISGYEIDYGMDGDWPHIDNPIKNKIFSSMTISLKEADVPRMVSYKFKNKRSVTKNFQLLFETVVKHYGQPYQTNEGFGTVSHYFNKGDEYITLSDQTGKTYGLSQFTIRINDGKISRSTDEFTKNTIISVERSYPYLNQKYGDSFMIEFQGMITELDKFMAVTISTTGENWKFIEKVILLTSDGDTFEKDLVTSRDIILGLAKETGSFVLPKAVASKIHSHEDMKIRIIGVENYDFQLNPPMFKAFDIIRKEIY